MRGDIKGSLRLVKQVMSVVKGLIKDNVTIVATIHSPTAYAFSLFNSLMMLIKGRVVYFGPQGT